MKKCISMLVCLALGTVMAGAAFQDVPQTHWAQPYVEKMAQEKVFEGEPDGSFRPEDALTRSQALALLARAGGWKLPERAQGAAWWQPYYQIARENDLLLDGEWRPDEAVMDAAMPRRELARLLSRTEKAAGHSVFAFSDISHVTEDDQWAICMCAGLGLMNGYPDGTFRPDGALTRAEAAVVMTRLTAMDALPEGAEPYYCTGRGWIAQKTDWKGAEIYYVDAVGGEVLDHYTVPMDMQVSESDYAPYYHAMALTGHNGTYFWGESGFYMQEGGRLKQLTGRPVTDYARDTVTGALYVVTHDAGVRIRVHEQDHYGDQIARVSEDGSLDVMLDSKLYAFCISDLPKAENGVVQFRTAGREGMTGTYYNEFELINGKVRVVDMSWLFFDEESERLLQEELDRLGIGVGA
ncbi:MAG: S-layer homology domain-containing protein [Agathobaculum sp.]|jgi:hypothetical protein|uniref:S-layer homology domain-containing protein n=1 Tax=Agathobaculum sp. TaxID=2048138 RepID=UPI003D92765A